MVHELRAKFIGRVQGVFFRATVKEHAETLGLVGIVKNLDDGSVEVILQGPKEVIEKFLNNVKASPGRANIESIEHEIGHPKHSYNSFNIIY